jgi:hypothetical protein
MDLYIRSSWLSAYLLNGQLLSCFYMLSGARGSVLVKALCYKPGSRSDEVIFLNVSNPSGCTSLGFTQSLTEMSTRNRKIIMFLGSRARPVLRADNLTAICEPIV